MNKTKKQVSAEKKEKKQKYQESQKKRISEESKPT